MKRHAFTLIELLIVVAIIAILAAIAIPNFLEAQTRSKASRAKNDQRTLALAMTSYQVDANKWPMDDFQWCIATNHSLTMTLDFNFNYVWCRLTSPIAYMSSIPTDPFVTKGYYDPWSMSAVRKSAVPRAPYTYRGQGWIANMIDEASNWQGKLTKSDFSGDYIVVSPGPDQYYNYSEWVLCKNRTWFPDSAIWWRVYDPTNGTVSIGDIVRWGP